MAQERVVPQLIVLDVYVDAAASGVDELLDEVLWSRWVACGVALAVRKREARLQHLEHFWMYVANLVAVAEFDFGASYLRHLALALGT